ncbi:IF4G1-like protein [Mya arenaria]|uniref:IF4G1-like protein n=1 Tax=Mya arenaria TaxID=6604 RepID=A0ABY7EW82_MYAAR|nr:IF4G1-like protein [Mya arenaria]
MPRKSRRLKPGTSKNKMEEKDAVSESQGLPSMASQTNKPGTSPSEMNKPIKTAKVELHKAEKPWKPSCLKSSTTIEVLVSRMETLKIDTKDKLKGVVDLVFEKAICEPYFSEVYANMCKCLSKPRMDQHFQQMAKLANDKKNTARVRFMIEDVISVRLNKWIPQCSNKTPQTIDQIHLEVARERHVEKLQKSQKGEIADRLHDIIVVRQEDNETVFNWIESNVEHATTAKSQFIRELMIAVCQSAITGLLRGYFDIFYDEDIITEDVFSESEEGENEPEGKTTALEQVVQFLEWLKEARADS